MTRVARSLEVLRGEFNAAYPRRDKASDGGLGDPAHAARVSDHNPNSAGVVCARDFDEDLVPLGGPVMEAVVQRIIAGARAGRLPQVRYVIYERRIWSRSSNFRQKAYSGVNAHDHHVHVSVEHAPHLYDRDAPWNVVLPADAPPPPPWTGGYTSNLEDAMTVAAVVKLGTADEKAPGSPVRALQGALAGRGYKGIDGKPLVSATGAGDGVAGPDTIAALKAFQKNHKLPVTGKTDARTLAMLMAV